MEMTMAANHFGHFLLTNLLLSELKATPNSRIINVSSVMHRFSYSDPSDDLSVEKGTYSMFKSYNRSKLANMLFTLELRYRLKESNVTAFAVHPGAVLTSIHNNGNRVGRTIFGFFLPILKLFCKSSVAGAYTSVYAAVKRKELLEEEDCWYFVDCHKAYPSKMAKDAKVAARLWDASCHIVGMSSAGKKVQHGIRLD